MTDRKTFPILPELEKNEVVITLETKPDKKGQQSFSIMWHRDNRLWDELGKLFTAERPDLTGGTCGQYFYGNLEERIIKYKEQGKKITIIDHSNRAR